MSSGTGGNFPAPVISAENQGINQAFQPFPYPNTTQAANNAYSGIPGDTNPAGQQALQSQGTNAINYGSSLPWQMAPIAQQGLTTGTNMYNDLAGMSRAPITVGQNTYNSLAGMSGVPIQDAQYVWQNLGEQAQGLEPYVTKALQAGFDPQNELYNRQFGLQQQQNLASQAMSGVGQSPYAAGLTAQGNENFNIDWQNQQLARQQMGAQTAGGLESQIANLAATGSNALNQGYQTGSNMLLGGANALNQGYQTGAGMDTAAMNALTQGINNYINSTGLGISGLEGLLGAGGNALTQAGGLNAQQVAQYLAYLQGSTNNASAATGGQLGALQQGTNLFGATNQGNLANQQQQSQAFGGLGQLGGTLLGNNLGGLGALGSSLGTAIGGGVL